MRTVGTPWSEARTTGDGPRPIVRMAQLAHVHRFDLVLTPAEQIGPGRVDAEKVAIEIANAEQVFGHFPDAITFARALFHLGLEPIGEGVQHFLVTHALGRFKGGGENAADPVGRRRVRDRAVADRKVRVLVNAVTMDRPRVIFGKEAGALTAQDGVVQRPKLAVDFRPDIAQRFSQRVRVPVAKQGGIGIVVDHDQIRPPSDGHGKAG